jgi:hypothetical protein
VQSGRIRVLAGVLGLAAAALVAGLWLVQTQGAGELDVAYGFASGDGAPPTLLVATSRQLVGVALIWLATVLAAGALGHRLTRGRASADR